jgi:indolepyruvate ferredoxin oxidoreductase beta subunit
MDTSPKAITVAILAMGGEGGGVLADWIVDLAEHSGYHAQATSVPGVAQRTGSTIYYLEIFPRTAGKEPVLALMPVPGELDIVIASELMEAGRAIQRSLVTPDRTTLIASTNRVYSMTEKTAMGDGRVESGPLMEACGVAAKVFVPGDFAAMAEASGSVISASLFGALAATRALPFDREQFEEAVERSGVGVESSLAAFAAGFQAAASPVAESAGEPAYPAVGPRLEALVTRIKTSFTPASHSILLAGIQRLADYQDERYAAEYLDRLEAVRVVDNGDCSLLRETARYLALWMSYEDAIRVADLKIRRTRFERVHQDARVGNAQLLEIHEFLYPRIQEIADILPAGIGRSVLNTRPLRWLVERLTRKGRILKTTSLSGFLQLYALASLRGWRRRSLRFERENKKINEWLAQIPALAKEDYALACEVAECPRLVKGYGDTHRLGIRNFDAVMGAVSRLRGKAGAADRLKQLREVALADESGGKLSDALREVTA